MDDSVQIKCNRCKNVFRDRARRLQNGYSRQCPSCEVVLFFDEDSQQPHIKTAMRAARRLRKELRELETVGGAPTAPTASRSRRYAGRNRVDARADE
jgi:predicted  nucleic acid-binding Zn-ribbon protein